MFSSRIFISSPRPHMCFIIIFYIFLFVYMYSIFCVPSRGVVMVGWVGWVGWDVDDDDDDDAVAASDVPVRLRTHARARTHACIPIINNTKNHQHARVPVRCVACAHHRARTAHTISYILRTRARARGQGERIPCASTAGLDQHAGSCWTHSSAIWMRDRGLGRKVPAER